MSTTLPAQRQKEPEQLQSRSLSTQETLSNELATQGDQSDLLALDYLRRSSEAQGRARVRRWIGVAIGLLPLVGTLIFIWFIATPMFATETRFAIRGGDAPTLSVGAFAGKGSGSDSLAAFVDGYAVRDYLESRAALKDLSQKIDFAAIAIRPHADPLVRLPAHADDDMLFDAYRSMVKVQFNIFEQIVVVRCFGFTPQDSVKLCQTVVEVSEAFADQMNRRAREDGLRVAASEVKAAEQQTIDARLAVSRWRDQNANVDPTADASMLGNLINQLETQRLSIESSLAQIRASSPNSPRRSSLEGQLQTLRDQIRQQRARLATAGDTDTAAGQIKSYEGLKAAQDFADTNLANLRQSLEQARIQMVRQQRFVAVIAQPLIDTTAAYPAKAIPLLTALIGGLAFAFFGSVIIGMMRGLLFA